MKASFVSSLVANMHQVVKAHASQIPRTSRKLPEQKDIHSSTGHVYSKCRFCISFTCKSRTISSQGKISSLASRSVHAAPGSSLTTPCAGHSLMSSHSITSRSTPAVEASMTSVDEILWAEVCVLGSKETTTKHLSFYEELLEISTYSTVIFSAIPKWVPSVPSAPNCSGRSHAIPGQLDNERREKKVIDPVTVTGVDMRGKVKKSSKK